MKIKICPNCGSTDIKIPPAGLDIRMTMRDYCQKCGLRGNFPEIDVENIEDFRKKLRK